jgi:hypothetical protein
MGLLGKIKNALKSELDKIKNGILDGIKKMFDAIIKPIRIILGALSKMFDVVRNFIAKILKLLIDGFNFIFYYIKCTIKIVKNFYKCFIFYIMDIIKYTFIYLPTMGFMAFMGTLPLFKKYFNLKKWKSTTKPSLDKGLGWPNGIMNDCYRCKNKDGNKYDLRDELRKYFEKEGVDDSKFNFLYFLLVALGIFGFLYRFWHVYVSDYQRKDSETFSHQTLNGIQRLIARFSAHSELPMDATDLSTKHNTTP